MTDYWGKSPAQQRMDDAKTEKMQSLESMRMYTLPEIAPVLGVTRPTLMRYITDGRLKAVKIGGKWKVSQNSLRRLIEGA